MLQPYLLRLCVFILLSPLEVKGATDNIGIYDVLHISSDATVDEIKRAWKSLRQQIHPDKIPDDPNATRRYQNMQKEVAKLLREREWESVKIHTDPDEAFRSSQADPNPKNPLEKFFLQVVFLSVDQEYREDNWVNYLEHEHPKTERRILNHFNNIFEMWRVDLSAQNSRGATALHLVIAPAQYYSYFSFFKAAKWLVQRNAKVNIPDGDGNSPVHKVFQMRPTYWTISETTDFTIQNDKRTLKMLKILASRTEKINAQIKNNKGETPLDMAVNKGYWRAVHWMINQTGIDNLSPEERERILTSDFKDNQSAHVYVAQTVINEIGGHNLGSEERREILTAAFTAKKQKDAMRIIRSMGNLNQEEQAEIRVMAVEKDWMKIARSFGKPRILTDKNSNLINQFLNLCKRRWESLNVN